MSERYPAPWAVEDISGGFVVKVSNSRPLAKLLTRDAARRIAVGIAKLPELLRKD